MEDKLKIGDFEFNSRLFIGTGKYENFEIMKKAHEASGAEVVTVAIRRVNFDNNNENLLNFIDKKLTILPNTAGCFSAEEAVRTARLARELGSPNWIKLKAIGAPKQSKHICFSAFSSISSGHSISFPQKLQFTFTDLSSFSILKPSNFIITFVATS